MSCVGVILQVRGVVNARDGDSRGETTAIRMPNHHPTNHKTNTVYQVHLGIVITLGPVRSGPVFSHWHLERSSYTVQ